ncbi:corA-like mg2+ transporter protein [Sarocladium implicatum]|nr:corA-like mg2+ transporter protein [Sarocladium implicatum]
MAKAPQHCCTERPRVHWRSFAQAQPADGDNEAPSKTNEWTTETFNVPLASRLSGSRPWEDANVIIFSTSANHLRKCETCKASLQEHYGLPAFWWSKYCMNGNGFFGSSATTDEQGYTVGHTSWGKFRVKLVNDHNNYSWYKINVFIHWRPTRTTMFLFDLHPTLEPQIPSTLFKDLLQSELRDPFWFYGYIFDELVRIQDIMVWEFRTKVRTMEKGRGIDSTIAADFGLLHDMARHSTHFLETFKLALRTMSTILNDHAALKLDPASALQTPSPEPASIPSIREKLRFLEHMLESLQYRAASNHERLHNEIQLTFNLVTQNDARTSLDLSRAMRTDGAATKALTFIAAAFLPATFICALFSMSFFNYEADSGWVMSGKIWIYFAFSIPITILSVGLWRYGSAIVSRL